jgi:hypothetical protein
MNISETSTKLSRRVKGLVIKAITFGKESAINENSAMCYVFLFAEASFFREDGEVVPEIFEYFSPDQTAYDLLMSHSEEQPAITMIKNGGLEPIVPIGEGKKIMRLKLSHLADEIIEFSSFRQENTDAFKRLIMAVKIQPQIIALVYWPNDLAE